MSDFLLSNPIISMTDPLLRRLSVAFVQCVAVGMLFVPAWLSNDYSAMPLVTALDADNAPRVCFILAMWLALSALIAWAVAEVLRAAVRRSRCCDSGGAGTGSPAAPANGGDSGSQLRSPKPAWQPDSEFQFRDLTLADSGPDCPLAPVTPSVSRALRVLAALTLIIVPYVPYSHVRVTSACFMFAWDWHLAL
jgi:hypothetical protein